MRHSISKYQPLLTCTVLCKNVGHATPTLQSTWIILVTMLKLSHLPYSGVPMLKLLHFSTINYYNKALTSPISDCGSAIKSPRTPTLYFLPLHPRKNDTLIQNNQFLCTTTTNCIKKNFETMSSPPPMLSVSENYAITSSHVKTNIRTATVVDMSICFCD